MSESKTTRFEKLKSLTGKIVKIDLLLKLLIAYFVFIFLLGDRGMLHLAISYLKLKQLTQEVRDLEFKKEEILSLIAAGKEKSKLELAAREKLGLIYAGERVILINQESD